MTPEQKERIARAAVELGAALTDVGADFDTDIRQIAMNSIHRAHPNYGYMVKVTLKTEEVIA